MGNWIKKNIRIVVVGLSITSLLLVVVAVKISTKEVKGRATAIRYDSTKERVLLETDKGFITLTEKVFSKNRSKVDKVYIQLLDGTTIPSNYEGLISSIETTDVDVTIRGVFNKELIYKAVTKPIDTSKISGNLSVTGGLDGGKLYINYNVEQDTSSLKNPYIGGFLENKQILVKYNLEEEEVKNNLFLIDLSKTSKGSVAIELKGLEVDHSPEILKDSLPILVMESIYKVFADSKKPVDYSVNTVSVRAKDILLMLVK